MKARIGISLLLFGLSLTVPVSAHHPLAEVFDRESSITLTGTVTEVDWVNPHVLFSISVRNEDGETERWQIEIDPPNALIRRGWSLDSLQVGDAVTVTGYRSINGSPTSAARTITLSTGEILVGTTEGSWNWRRLEPSDRIRILP